MYDSKLEVNRPFEPCMCCSQEVCLEDRIHTAYLDKPPFRSGMCCVCIPCTCCGPPVIFSKTPKCLCIDMTDCFGQQVMAAPSNCYGLKTCICCCSPCYQTIASPVVMGVIDASKFMSHMKAASDAYYLKHPEIPNGERVIFEEITDNIGIVGSAKAVESDSMNRS